MGSWMYQGVRWDVVCFGDLHLSIFQWMVKTAHFCNKAMVLVTKVARFMRPGRHQRRL